MTVRTVDPSGVTGPPMEAPNCGGASWGVSGGLTDRPGRDGQFLAYLGEGNEVYLWRVGSGTPLLVGTGAAPAPAAEPAPVAATADRRGRVWVVWSAAGGLHAARTDAAVTRVERRVTTTPPGADGPPGGVALYASAKGDGVDVVWSGASVWVRHLSG